MAIRNILLETDEALRKVSRPITHFDERLRTLLDDMAQTMYQANGVGLAAPQVGVLRRAIVIDIGEELIELINPEIIEAKGEQDGTEGCLSSPGQFGMVCRPNFITVKAQDRYGKEFTLSGEGYLARAFAHEIDHLNGVLFKDLASRMLTEEELLEAE